MMGFRSSLLTPKVLFLGVNQILGRYILLAAAIFSFSSCKPPSPQNTVVAEKQESLHLLIKSGYLPAGVVDTFVRETGIPVSIQVCDSDVEMQRIYAKSSEIYDIMQPAEGLAAEWAETGKLFPISDDNIPNLKNLDTCFRNLSFDSSNRYTVPYLAGIMGILYNSAQVEGEIKDFDGIFNVKYSGRIAIPTDNREVIASAVIQLNLQLGQITPSNLEDIRKRLTNWLPLVGSYSSQVPAQTLLRRGDAVVAIMRSGEAAILVQEDPKFKWVVPTIGAHLFVENFVISAQSTHKLEAARLLNFLLRPDINAKISRQYPYFNSNQVARAVLPQEEQRCLCLLPTDFSKNNLQVMPPLNSPILQSLEKFVEGIRPK